MSAADAKRRLSDWFRQWRAPLRRFLGRLGAPDADIDDIAQEAFLRLLRYDNAELIEHPQAYLFKIAANVTSEWALRASNQQPHREEWLEGLAGGNQPDSPLFIEQARREVARAMATLTPRQQQLLWLYFSDSLTYAEIAAASGETLRSVRKQFEKGYERLRNELDPELLGVFTHGRY